jgi:hypothetical protein
VFLACYSIALNEFNVQTWLGVDELAMSYILATCVCILGAGFFFLPSLIGHFRRAAAIRNISALNALALLTLVCSLASSWSLLATGAVWVAALAMALGGRKLIAQPGASPNGGPTEPFANSGVGGGPPSVS